MEMVMQRMVKIPTGMMQAMTQYMVNCDSKELPPGMQQVLDNHSRMVQMMPQILASINNNLPQNNLGSKEPRDEDKIVTSQVFIKVWNKQKIIFICID
jgi:hypothetical protein